LIFASVAQLIIVTRCKPLRHVNLAVTTAGLGTLDARPLGWEVDASTAIECTGCRNGRRGISGRSDRRACTRRGCGRRHEDARPRRRHDANGQALTAELTACVRPSALHALVPVCALILAQTPTGGRILLLLGRVRPSLLPYPPLVSGWCDERHDRAAHPRSRRPFWFARRCDRRHRHRHQVRLVVHRPHRQSLTARMSARLDCVRHRRARNRAAVNTRSQDRIVLSLPSQTCLS
jgi:hypothetical protein